MCVCVCTRITLSSSCFSARHLPLPQRWSYPYLPGYYCTCCLMYTTSFMKLIYLCLVQCNCKAMPTPLYALYTIHLCLYVTCTGLCALPSLNATATARAAHCKIHLYLYTTHFVGKSTFILVYNIYAFSQMASSTAHV